MREERTAEGIFLVPPDAPGLGLAAGRRGGAAAALVPE